MSSKQKLAFGPTIPTEGKDRLIVIGDLHGTYDELSDLVEKVYTDPDKDIIVLVGDLLDRGPKCAAVLDTVYEAAQKKEIHVVQGNHDNAHYRYYRHRLKKAADPSYIIPMKEIRGGTFHEQETYNQDALEWLGSLPSYVLVGNTLVVHAGLMPGKPLDKQLHEMVIRARYLDKETDGLTRVKDIKDWSKVYFWDEKYTGPHRVVYGHEVWPNGRMLNNCYGIDGGCVYGNKLVAYIEDLHTHNVTFETVKAYDTYLTREE